MFAKGIKPTIYRGKKREGAVVGRRAKVQLAKVRLSGAMRGTRKAIEEAIFESNGFSIFTPKAEELVVCPVCGRLVEDLDMTTSYISSDLMCNACDAKEMADASKGGLQEPLSGEGLAEFDRRLLKGDLPFSAQ